MLYPLKVPCGPYLSTLDAGSLPMALPPNTAALRTKPQLEFWQGTKAFKQQNYYYYYFMILELNTFLGFRKSSNMIVNGKEMILKNIKNLYVSISLYKTTYFFNVIYNFSSVFWRDVIIFHLLKVIK